MMGVSRYIYKSTVCLFVLASLVFFAGGCASKSKSVSSSRYNKKVVSYSVDMDPVVTIKGDRSIRKVYVGNFNNTTDYSAAGVVFTNALRFKLQDKGYELVQSKELSDISLEGDVTDIMFKRDSKSFVKIMISQIASGPAGRKYRAEIGVKFKLIAGRKMYQTRLYSRTITHEKEIAMGINEASVRLVERLIRQFK